MGMGEDGRVGLPRNLLHERLRWLLPPPSRVPEPHSCLSPVLFYLLRVLSGVMASRRSNANDSGSTWPPFRGKKKSCNVLSATLIRETHREPVAWRQLSSWYLPCMLITSPPGSESALSLGWWQRGLARSTSSTQVSQARAVAPCTLPRCPSPQCPSSTTVHPLV